MIPLTGISVSARAASAAVLARYRRRGYGPGNTPEVRAWVVRRMRAEGATQKDCATLFGCSVELIRHIEMGRFPVYVSAEEADLIHEHRRAREAGGG